MLQAMTISNRRANPLRKLPCANCLLNQRLNLLPVHCHRYLLDWNHKPRHVPRAQPGANCIAQASFEVTVEAVAVAHDDEKESGFVGINAFSASPDAEGCLDDLVEGVSFGYGVDL